jgi:ABC-2 type transport system ATP-binding protein
VIEVRQLYHRYRGAAVDVLRGIDLRVPDGSLFGLVGPNGAGKTTLLALLSGVLSRDGRGEILVRGERLAGRMHAARAGLALVPQDHAFYPTLTGRENLRFFGGVHGLGGSALRGRIDACIAAGALEAVIDRPAGTYSGGLRRRLNLAIGLLAEPSLLFLDEPTVGIDIQSRAFILDTIRALHREGTTIVYTSHYMEEVQQLCDEIAIIDAGVVLIQDRLDALFARAGGDTLRIELDAPLSDPAVRAALSCDADTSGAELSVPCSADPAAIAGVLAVLAKAGARVRRIEYGRRDLDALLLDLTDRALRD